MTRASSPHWASSSSVWLTVVAFAYSNAAGTCIAPPREECRSGSFGLQRENVRPKGDIEQHPMTKILHVNAHYGGVHGSSAARVGHRRADRRRRRGAAP